MEAGPMNIRCEQIDDLLLEGDSISMQAAARHAEGCPACLEKLTEWNEISDTARGLKTTWESDLLWPGIERALRAEKRSRWQSQILRIAAIVAVSISLAAVSWYAGVVRSRQEFRKEILVAVDDAETAQKQYERAIARLENLAESKLESSNTPLMVSYKEKLMLLDDAIAECQQNIEQNRNNAHLRKQLLAIYSEKQQTLRDVLREGNHESNQ